MIWALKNMEKMETMPTAFMKDPVFRKLGEVARVAALDKKERREYERSLKMYRDNYAIFTTERREGFAEGLAEGEAKGIAIMVKKMRSNGMTIPEIATITGYPPEKIENIIKA